MSKTMRDMTEDELTAEMEAWGRVLMCPYGPGQPSNAAREFADAMYRSADGWRARRNLESSGEDSE